MMDKADSDNEKTQGVPEGAYLIFNQMIFPIMKPVTHIGRKPENDMVIKEISVSRFHAQIRVDNGQFALFDLNSHNGVMVNNKMVNQIVLKSGMMIHLGEVVVVFVQEDRKTTESLEMDTGELKAA